MRLLERALAVLALSTIVLAPVNARDDGRFAGTPLHDWFNKLASPKGLCCSFADGRRVEDADWDTVKDADGIAHYRVNIDGQWIVVPDEAVITEPNRAGFTIAWPYTDLGGKLQIRCFIVGSGS